MALDAATLALTAKELKKILLEARIDTIFEPTRNEIVLQLRTCTSGHQLFLLAHSGTPRVWCLRDSF